MDLSEPKVMGILNITPDSFYAKSRRTAVNDVLKATEKMLSEGATFIDVGGYSSRPGAADISVEEEIQRIVVPIECIAKEFPECITSIDTFRAKVARAAVDAGANLINDISGGHLDDEMLTTVASLKVPYIGMHMRGTPQNMKALTDYDDLLLEMGQYFAELKSRCQTLGINDLIIDPGFGFAKTVEQNFDLLKNLEYFKHQDCPILVGLSRKSMIWKTLEVNLEDALNGTSGLNAIALLKGANILRVHDVKEAVELTKLVGKLR